MIDTTQLPPGIQARLADYQPLQWIPLPATPGTASLMIPVHTQATPRLMTPWELDQTLTTPATRVYRWAQENLAALVHGNTLSLVQASDPVTLQHTLAAFTESQTPVQARASAPERSR